MSSLNNECPICHSKKIHVLSQVQDYEYSSSEESFKYLQCDNCKVVFIERFLEDRLAEIYPDNYYSNEGPAAQESGLKNFLEQVKSILDRAFFRRILSRIHKSKIQCLDIGGGSGWMMDVVRASDNRVVKTVIVDINENSRAIAETKGHTFIKSNIEAVDINEKFDMVTILNLIEHVADPLAVFKKIHSLLDEEGRVVIKTPNVDSLNFKFFKNRYWGGFHAPRHWIIFNKSSLVSLAEKAGFKIEIFEYTQGAHQWAASILGTFKMQTHSKDKKPLHEKLSFTFLVLCFAVFDMLFKSFLKTDQMFVVLKKSESIA